MRIARRVQPATALFLVAAAASGTLLLVWQSNLTFFYDDWEPLLQRRGLSLDVLLRPHIGHLLLATTAIYKAIQATIGMESLLPYAVASTAAFLLSVGLLYVHIRRRVGDWFALAGVLPILFLGSASADLLFPFQIFFFGAMAAGLGALLAIERGDRVGDALACGFLVISLTFSELALPFALGVAVAIAQERGPLRRAYVVGVPALLYAIWYAGWGHTAESALSAENVARSVPYVLDGLASGLASLLGFTAGGFGGDDALTWGRPLLLVALGLAALRLRSRVPVSRWFWVALVILLSFWFLTAINANPLRSPAAGRYQYIAAVLLLLVAAELACGVVRQKAAWVLCALGVAGIALLGNLAALRETYRGFHETTATVRGGLAGLEIVSDTVNPGLILDERNSGFAYVGSVEAGPYLSAVRSFGSPAYSESELPSAPERARVAADLVMGAALDPSLRPAEEPPATSPSAPRVLAPPGSLRARRGGCATVRPGGGSAVLSLPPGGAFLKPAAGTRAEVALRRFASESFPVAVGTLTRSAVLPIGTDRSSRPWQAQLIATGAVTACGL